MKAIGISGSPRHGNTETMVSRVLKGCKEKGAATHHFLLRDIKMDPCCGEDECWHTELCSSDKDELTEVFQEIKEADALVLGSPNYFNSVSWLFKIFIDRTNPYAKFKRFQGKKVVLVIAPILAILEHFQREFHHLPVSQLGFGGSGRKSLPKPRSAATQDVARLARTHQ